MTKSENFDWSKYMGPNSGYRYCANGWHLKHTSDNPECFLCKRAELITKKLRFQIKWDSIAHKINTEHRNNIAYARYQAGIQPLWWLHQKGN